MKTLTERYVEDVRTLAQACRDFFPVDDETETLKDSDQFRWDGALEAISLRISDLKRSRDLSIGRVLGDVYINGELCVPDIEGDWEADPAYNLIQEAICQLESHLQDGRQTPIPATIINAIEHGADVLKRAHRPLKEARIAKEEKTKTNTLVGGDHATSEPPNVGDQMQQVALAVGDDNAVQILAIAQRKDLSGESKMQEILGLDRRFAGKNSCEWSTLLGVTDAAVRGYRTWKSIQPAKNKDG